MTIHLVGLPHTALHDVDYPACAFTTKAVRWIEILKGLGKDTIAYWGGGPSNANCEVVELYSNSEREHFFGEHVAESLPFINWDERELYWKMFNDRAIEQIQQRIQPGDMVAVWAGGHICQRVIDAFKADHTVIEPAVGYLGIGQDTFCAFESYAWMHHVYGKWDIRVGRHFDTVIPNFLRPEDFPMGPNGNYLLYVGRLTKWKGVDVAADIAARAQMPFWVAGQGMLYWEDNELIFTDNTHVRPVDEFYGVVGPEKRSMLLRCATAVIVPTQYIEPFGTVHAEALMSGVPVLTTDFGVFTETVRPGLDGWRFRSLAEADWALQNLPERGVGIRQAAIDRFSLDAVTPQWDRWFRQLETLRDGSGGWYSHG